MIFDDKLIVFDVMCDHYIVFLRKEILVLRWLGCAFFGDLSGTMYPNSIGILELYR